MDWESELISLISRLLFSPNLQIWDSFMYLDSESVSVIIRIISVVSLMDLNSQPKPESEFMSLITQAISVFYSMDFDSQPTPLQNFISYFLQKISLANSMHSDSNRKWLLPNFEKIYTLEPEPELVSLIYQIFSLVTSMESKSRKFICLCPQKQVTFENGRFHVSEEEVPRRHFSKWECLPLNWEKFNITGEDATRFYCFGCKGKNHEEYKKAPIEIKHNHHRKHSLQLVFVLSSTRQCYCRDESLKRVFYYCSACDFAINVACPILLGNSMDSESDLISLISRLLFFPDPLIWNSAGSFYFGSKAEPLFIPIISMVSSMDMNSQPKPESEFMSLITQAISVFYSMDFDSQPKQLQNFISYYSQKISANSVNSNSNRKLLDPNFERILTLEPEPELVSLIYQIVLLVISIKPKSEKVISLCPQFLVTLKNGKFLVLKRKPGSMFLDLCGKWACLPWFWLNLRFPGEEDTPYFCCEGCKGKNHEEYKEAPVEIKHHLHLKHSLQLVLLEQFSDTRQCYCCDEDLERVFYNCSACDFAINFACVKKPRVLSIDYPKWHEHTLHLFPRHASLTCNLCASADAISPLYMCPNCDFVAHRRCINLPRVIRISRHGHRISFTTSFDQGDLSCGICRREIDNDYGGYSCIKDGCSYAAHSRCATQSNVWDGKELEGEPEEEMEELLKPFVRISDGIIQHFSHQHHHLKLDENTGRDYDENRECQACITPIYFGNFYSCMQCDFILHDECANLSRKIYNPIHPHMLTLGYDYILDEERCTACRSLGTTRFFYKCSKYRYDYKLFCHNFRLHVQCATISEPLVHESHIHPLFLTSKPGEEPRLCSVCSENLRYGRTNETFNCIEECDFALCFGCATLPHKVRYKHDKHILTLSYGKETSTMTYWCEVCEGKVDPQKRFYMCDEYCCVTLHIECLLGKDLFMKPGSSWSLYGEKVQVLPNNHHMTRPICYLCKRRCPHKIFFQFSGSNFCSLLCLEELNRRQYYLEARRMDIAQVWIKLVFCLCCID